MNSVHNLIFHFYIVHFNNGLLSILKSPYKSSLFNIPQNGFVYISYIFHPSWFDYPSITLYLTLLFYVLFDFFFFFS